MLCHACHHVQYMCKINGFLQAIVFHAFITANKFYFNDPLPYQHQAMCEPRSMVWHGMIFVRKWKIHEKIPMEEHDHYLQKAARYHCSVCCLRRLWVTEILLKSCIIFTCYLFLCILYCLPFSSHTISAPPSVTSLYIIAVLTVPLSTYPICPCHPCQRYVFLCMLLPAQNIKSVCDFAAHLSLLPSISTQLVLLLTSSNKIYPKSLNHSTHGLVIAHFSITPTVHHIHIVFSSSPDIS